MGTSPLPVPPHVFAIAPGRLDYGCFARSGGRFQLTSYHSVELPADTFYEGILGGSIREPESFAKGLGEFVAGLGTPVKSASLVLPDAWLRLAFTEAGDLPRNGQAREDVLRWKLKRLVPFRVDELRIRGVEVTPLARQQEPRRLLLGFGAETLLGQLEAAFTAAEVRLGQITSASLSLLGAVAPSSREAGLDALALVTGDGYTLIFARGDEPVLHRHKSSGGDYAASSRAAMVLRDLKLTRTFLEQQLPDRRIGRVLVAAPAATEPEWVAWLTEGLGEEAEPLSWQHLPPFEGVGEHPLFEMAPLLGAANLEVA